MCWLHVECQVYMGITRKTDAAHYKQRHFFKQYNTKLQKMNNKHLENPPIWFNKQSKLIIFMTISSQITQISIFSTPYQVK